MYRLSKLFKSLAWLFGSFFLVLTGALVVADENELLNWGLWERGKNKVLAMSWQGEGEIVETLTEIDRELSSAEQQEIDWENVGEAQDARAKLVANFIERNDIGGNSPLQPYDEYGQIFVDIADKYGLDFRLLPAIARKESTFCKSNIGRKYYNCFGWGVPASGITEAGKFNSYEEGIEKVAAGLKKNYLDKGLTDPIAIMRKYCPPSAEGEGTWANHLNQWMAEMRYDDKTVAREKGYENTDLTEFVE